MKFTILYDNEAFTGGLRHGLGFSCMMEGAGKKLLFDIGGVGWSKTLK
jgi:metal-dependent hydrolase (beta-lactamase superfamily II)